MGLKKKTVKAAKGVKQVRDAVGTRARILEKATQVFALSGYDGTSIGEIVKASRVNKRMIYHYFGDKKGLYRAIFRSLWGEFKSWTELELQRRLDAGIELPVDAASLLLETIVIGSDFMASNQRFVRLLMWEGLEGGEISRSIWTDVRGPLYAQVEFFIKQAQEEGRVDPDLKPAHLVISFLGAIGFYFAYAPALADMLHQDPFAPAALEERKRELKRLFSGIFVN